MPSRARALNLFRLYQCFTKEEGVNNYSRKSKGNANPEPKNPVSSHLDLQTSPKRNFSSIGNSRNVSSSNSPIKSKNIHSFAEKSCNAEKNVKSNELLEKHSHISCKEEKTVTSKSSACEEASLNQGNQNNIRMKTQKSTQLNVKMSRNQQHAVFKRKYKNEGNLLNEKGEDRKLGKDVTENDQSMKSETLEPRSASLRNLAIYYVRILKIPIYLVVHTCIMKKTHVYKVQHQLEIKTNILYKTNMPFKMWKMKSYTKTNFFFEK